MNRVMGTIADEVSWYSLVKENGRGDTGSFCAPSSRVRRLHGERLQLVSILMVQLGLR